MVIILKLQFLSAMSIKIIKSLQQNVYVTNFQHWIKIYKNFLAEGAFKKLKPEPNSGGLSSLSGSGISSPGSGISSLPHVGHTPTTVSCPTPARRRHRTTFTQVCKARASTQTLQEKNIQMIEIQFTIFFLFSRWWIGTIGRTGSSFCEITLSRYLL